MHPAEGPTYESGVRHQITLMCDDIGRTIAELRGKGVIVAGEPKDEGSGITVMLTLPGDCRVMLTSLAIKRRSEPRDVAEFMPSAVHRAGRPSE